MRFCRDGDPSSMLVLAFTKDRLYEGPSKIYERKVSRGQRRRNEPRINGLQDNLLARELLKEIGGRAIKLLKRRVYNVADGILKI